MHAAHRQMFLVLASSRPRDCDVAKKKENASTVFHKISSALASRGCSQNATSSLSSTFTCDFVPNTLYSGYAMCYVACIFPICMYL